MENRDPNATITRKVLTETLGEFTEQVLLPAMQRVVSTEVSAAKQELRKDLAATKHELKVYIDEKLGDLRGDIVLLTRKEDRKVLRLVDLLRQKRVLTDPEAKELLGMEPFAIT